MRIVSLLFHDVYASDAGESGFRSPAADRYKLTVPAFEAQLDGLWDVEAQLTFDDGGLSYYTVVADRLEAVGRRGYCFVTTDFIGQRGFLSPEQIRELDARGHVIGTHSASHPARFSALTTDEMRDEWSGSRMKLEDILNRSVQFTGKAQTSRGGWGYVANGCNVEGDDPPRLPRPASTFWRPTDDAS